MHINTSNVNLSYVYLRHFKSLGAKVICHSHNVISYKNIFPYNLMITYKKNFIVKHSDLLLSCSSEAGYAMFGRKARFNVLKNYIDSNRFTYNPIWRDEIREESSAQIVLGHIGAFNGQKNQIFLLNLMEYLDDRFELILVGDGERKEECISYCNIHNLTDRVRFYPSCVDVEKYYSAFDIFLLPSFHEGMGLVLLEATASNLNLIASEFVPVNPVFDCEYLPLDHKLWVAKIQEIAGHINERFDNTRKIIDEGYDRSTAVIPLSKYYNELIE